MTAIDRIRYFFSDRNDNVKKLILINIVVFMTIHVVKLVSWAVSGSLAQAEIERLLYLPADLGQLVFKPWSLITYMFAHQGFFHILFNMLWLWYLGTLFQDYLGTAKLLKVYFWGGIAGAFFFILFMNILPVLSNSAAFGFPLLGASASVLAVVTAVATLIPDYSIRFFFFDVKLKYIAIGAAVISLFSIPYSNAGGNLAHLGGILFGFLYIKQIQNHTILDSMSDIISNGFNRVFGKKKDEKRIYKSYTIYMKTENDLKPNQDDVDAILDKINHSGYESLSSQEKEVLYKASRQD
jgi:membrane associated rhomboid family serine protease